MVLFSTHNMFWLRNKTHSFSIPTLNSKVVMALSDSRCAPFLLAFWCLMHCSHLMTARLEQTSCWYFSVSVNKRTNSGKKMWWTWSNSCVLDNWVYLQIAIQHLKTLSNVHETKLDLIWYRLHWFTHISYHKKGTSIVPVLAGVKILGHEIQRTVICCYIYIRWIYICTDTVCNLTMIQLNLCKLRDGRARRTALKRLSLFCSYWLL